MADAESAFGQIEISPTAVATIASEAVNQCYGVVGMSSRGFVNGIAQLLSRDSSRKGIEVHIDEDGVVIDVYVIIEYGIRIRAVAESVQKTVKFHVEKALGSKVAAVNVYVQGLRLGEEQK